MSRRNGRILAVQALYSYDLGKIPLEELLEFEWTKESAVDETESSEDVTLAQKEARDYARIVISGTVEHLAEIDAQIKSHLTGKWDFDRVNKVSVAILRMSVYSLMYQKDVSPSIVIDEAVSISKDFGTDDSYKFINAILDNIRKGL